MTSLAICLLCFAVTFMLARRSPVWGLAGCIGLGYVFGVLKANIFDTFSFFIWDASVLGFYASYFSKRPSPKELVRTEGLRLWVAALIVWPVLLTVVPLQYPLIQLVGLRANVFLLPFLLIGARLKPEEFDELASVLAALNLAALGLALTEYFFGLEQFFPRNQVTELIYKSRDVAGYTAFRIPGFFINAHAYAGTMVMTIPFLLGAWVSANRPWRKNLLSAGMMAALLGVFLAASRTHMIMLCALMIFALLSGELKLLSRASLVVMLICTAWVVSNNERLQRFTTLLDMETVKQRVSSSINLPFVEAALEYPFGVGMGGGGTSIPYFLHDEIIETVAAENEYVRIMLEEGILGLGMWVAFIAWTATRRSRVHMRVSPGRRLARFLTVGYFIMACLGTGLLASVPHSLLLLLAAGWASSGMESAIGKTRVAELAGTGRAFLFRDSKAAGAS
jgi:hypothetical protein